MTSSICIGMFSLTNCSTNSQPFTLTTRDTTMATTTKAKTKARKKYDGPTGEEKLVMELVELMQRGVSPWKKDWGGTATFRNLITGHEYQGANPAVLHMYMQAREFTLPLFCGAGQPRKQALASARVPRLATSSGLNSAQQKPRTRRGTRSRRQR